MAIVDLLVRASEHANNPKSIEYIDMVLKEDTTACFYRPTEDSPLVPEPNGTWRVRVSDSAIVADVKKFLSRYELTIEGEEPQFEC